ncbi:MAG: hypothetical protein JNM21_14905 [Taibaiella sp.]|nr:hypothetical protein [Taibaiella sp.]
MFKKSLSAVLLIAISFSSQHLAVGQVPIKEKVKQNRELINSDNYIAGYLLDSIAKKEHRTLSGTQIAAGKSFSTSASITDKGATVNINLPQIFKDNIYNQVNISGTGKDNFVSLLEDGRYGNTISGGIVFNVFGKAKASYYTADKKLMKLKIDDMLRKFDPDTNKVVYQKDIDFVKEQIKSIDKHSEIYFKWVDGKDIKIGLEEAKIFLKAVDTLAKLELIDDNFLNKSRKNISGIIAKLKKQWLDADNRTEQIVDYRYRLFLNKSEPEQISAPWTSFRHYWFSAGASLNTNPNYIFDIKAVDEKYVKVDNNYFFSGFLAFNRMKKYHIKNQFRFYWSPTLRLSNSRQYNPDNIVKLERHAQYPIGADSLVQKKMTTEFYEKLAERKWAVSLEVPLIWYWNKRHFGFEMTPKVGINDIMGDNIGLKLGIFVPVQVKEGTPLIIQPILRFQKLFAENKNNEIEHSFFKDNIVFGFNLSIQLPKGIDK